MFFGGNLSWVYVKVTWVKDPTIFALSCLQNGKKLYVGVLSAICISHQSDYRIGA